VIGERWTLVIVQELMKRPSRYGELLERLPGISTSVLADRLRRLETAGVLERRPAPVGEGNLYELTARGRELETPLQALREWGVSFLVDPSADGHREHRFNMSYVKGIDTLPDATFELRVDGHPTTLTFSAGALHQRAGAPTTPQLAVHTSSTFMSRWAAGDVDWDDGRATGEVAVEGSRESWPNWLAATGYLLAYPPETSNDRPR
jgi:DNA-binding HxlR family transcriptional regulator